MAKPHSRPARPAKATGKTNGSPTVSTVPSVSYVSTWLRVQQPNGEILHKPGKPIELGDYIKVREAAKLLDLSVTRIHSLINSGEIPESAIRRPGSKRRGQFQILRSAILARLGPVNLE